MLNSYYKQYCEEAEKVDKLENKIKHLKAENTSLKNRMDYFESNIEAVIAKAVEAATTPLNEIIERQEIQLEAANNEISRLKAIINKDSSNSSKPPSSDGFKEVMNSREKSERKQGGQFGHKGHRLGLPKNMEELEKTGTLERRVEDYSNGSEPYVSRYQIDVVTKVIVTEYRFALDAQIPPELYNEVTYGDETKATMLMLLNEGIVPKKRLGEIISGLTHKGVNMSPATMESIQKEFAEKLVENKEIEAIEEDLLNSEVMNVDDSSLKTTERIIYDPKTIDEVIGYETKEKGTYGATIRTHSNPNSTLLTVNPGKGEDGVIRDNILPRFFGIIVQDFESKFFKYGIKNAACVAHLLRTLMGLVVLYKRDIAGEIAELFRNMNAHKEQDIQNEIDSCDPTKLASFSAEYDELVRRSREIIKEDPDEFGKEELRVIIDRLETHKDKYMLFMEDYQVPWTNNLAERDLRMDKTKQKVSGTFRSWTGITTHATNRSFISTVKKRGLDLVGSVRDVFKGKPVLSS